MFKTVIVFLSLYLIIGVILASIYNSHAPKEMKLCTYGIMIYVIMWPLLLLCGM